MSYLGQQLGQGQAERFVFTASGGETSVTTSDDGRAIAYTVGQVDVYLNGAKLINGSDFTATTGTSITGLAALTASDVVEVFALSIFQASDTVSAASGGTFNGNVTVDANLSVTGTVDIDTSLNVDGTVTADGLTVDASNSTFNGAIGITSAAGAAISEGLLIDYSTNLARFLTYDSSTGSELAMYTQPSGGSTAQRFRINSTGDISFYEDTGTTPKFFWDASAEALGIGTTSPGTVLDINRPTSTASYARVGNGGNVQAYIGVAGDNLPVLGSYTNHALRMVVNAAEVARFDTSGNFGIGGTPTAPLHVFGGGILGASSTNPIAFTGSSGQNAGIGSYNANTDLNFYSTGTGNIKFRGGAVWNSSGVLTAIGSEFGRFDPSGNFLVGTTENPGGRFSLKAGANQHSKVVDSVNVIGGSSESAVMAEGTVAVNTTSLGTVLSIPFYSQGSVWRRYIIEFMFSSGEYNDSGNGKSGTATVRLASLTTLSGVTLLDSTGTVSSVGSSGMNLQITFSSGFTGGLNNYEGVLVYYKVLSSHPSYFQPWNATLN